MLAELHLFIIWEKGRIKQKEILSDIENNFQIIRIFEISWSKGKSIENFTRFYGTNLNSAQSKQKECGDGPFILVVVYDNKPSYALRTTSKGDAIVNTRTFELKNKYREWTNGGHKIHATNNTIESNHDLTLLLGLNTTDFLKSLDNQYDYSILKIKRDVSGAYGWKSVEELFYILNNTVNYVVLRGEKNVYYNLIDQKHEDIDILIEQYWDFIVILNGESCCSTERPHEKITIKGRQYIFDLWDIQRYYFDPEWMFSMIEHRQLNNGIFILSNEDKFYHILYHSIIIKGKIAKDYQEFIDEECSKRNITTDINRYLYNYLKKNNYEVTIPSDKSISIHNKEALNYHPNKTLIQKHFAKYPNGITIYTSVYKTKLNNQYVFCKQSNIDDIIKNEKELLLELRREIGFPKVVLYPQDNCICITEINASTMKDFFCKQYNPYFIQSFVKKALNRINILTSHNILHRDLSETNILIKRKSINSCQVFLIDFAFSEKITNNDDSVKLTPIGLCAKYRPPIGYSDYYSLGMLLVKFFGQYSFIQNISKALMQITALDYYDRQILQDKIKRVNILAQSKIPLRDVSIYLYMNSRKYRYLLGIVKKMTRVGHE